MSVFSIVCLKFEYINSTIMKKLILTYGIIAGIIVSVMMLFSFSGTTEGSEPSELLGYATMVIAFSTIFFAIKIYRDKYLSGTITFGKSFQIGLAITVIASILYVITWMIISNTIAKDFMAEYYQRSIEQIKNSELSPEEILDKIAQAEKFMELYKNPAVKIGITFLEIFPVGLIISLISSIILKKK